MLRLLRLFLGLLFRCFCCRRDLLLEKCWHLHLVTDDSDASYAAAEPLIYRCTVCGVAGFVDWDDLFHTE